jgi:hypothetical protein
VAYLRCTKKLLKQIGLDAAVQAREDASTETDDDWYAYLIWLEGRKCVLFTNIGTLYPFMVLDARKAQLRELPALFLAEYERNLVHLGANTRQIARELSRLSDLEIGKTQNPRVLGSMNDYAFQADVFVYASGGIKNADPLLVSERLGKAPMSVIGYSSGIKELRNRLEARAIQQIQGRRSPSL